MSRTGVERKPTWSSIPAPIRRAAEEQLGAAVARAMRVWGGYSATPSFRLRLKDGRRVFLKAADPVSNPFAYDAHAREERVYRELAPLVREWSPGFIGSFTAADWRVMLLEDLGPKSAPPWTPSLVRTVVRDLAAFHRSTAGAALPGWVPRTAEQLTTGQWLWDWTEREGTSALAALAGAQSGEAMRWLGPALPALARASRGMLDTSMPQTLLHRDVRSDNLRVVDRRLKMFDWPHAGLGPPAFDLAGFAQTVTIECGVEPEEVVKAYSASSPVSREAVDAAVASIASYFACQAWRPELPGLPRLRAFQRAQLKVTLRWAASRLRLPEPRWLDAVRA